MNKKILKVGKLIANPGEKIQGNITLKVSDDNIIDIPVTLINGIKEGKTVAITAAVHGGEYTGVFGLIKLSREISPQDLSGQLILVHITNVSAFEAKMQYVGPIDGKNLNRCFPGDKNGTHTEQLAYFISEEVYGQSDFFLDLHSGDIHEDLMPFTLYHRDASEEVRMESRKIGELMNLGPVIGSGSDCGSINGMAMKYNIPGVLAELGCRGECNVDQAILYKDRILNVLYYYGLLDGEAEVLNPEEVDYVHCMYCLDADIDGLWYPSYGAGDEVSEGELVGYITDYFGNILREYHSPVNGRILYNTTSLAIRNGDPLISFISNINTCTCCSNHGLLEWPNRDNI